MDMNKAFFLRREDQSPRWRLIDATDKVPGRLATEIANILRGKDVAHYTPHADAGDYVVVINADKLLFTGNKLEDKEYVWYTGWLGGQKRLTAKQRMEKDSTQILFLAVKGMLEPNKMTRAQLTKLKIYAGDKHPHTAQLAGLGRSK
jgi:large subunit ribosomal protein L13